ncbi:MAG: MarR family transcriptional regulator [Bacteroidales bacterium]|nr:MarR family transcriptional regulator [Bacteroidales bacterium]MBR1436499.1 MarR family transcriptional regulator [Bacteroidales bacterium]
MYEQLKLDNQLCFRFYTVSRLITQAYGPMLEKLGVTYPQYLVLLVLWEKDSQPVNDIAKRLLLNTNTVTPLLKRMEDEGLLSRKKGTEDARQVIVSLTDKGKELEEQAMNIPFQLLQKFSCTNLDQDQVAFLAPTLDSLIDTLK